MPNILITGASRGLGLEFCRQYAVDGWHVYAGCRTPERAEALNALAADSGGRVRPFGLDVDHDDSVAAAGRELADATLDIVINNAGVVGSRGASLGSMDYESWQQTLNTNVLGPMRVAEAFADRLHKTGEQKLVTISSRMGSITEAAPNAMIYRSSKAAVNMVVKCLSIELARRGVIAVTFHPGWVQTDMGGAGATLTPKESVSSLRRVIAGLGPGDNGRFLDYDGSPISW